MPTLRNMSADGLLAVAQWLLVGLGLAYFCVTIAGVFVPVSELSYSYTYPDGTVVVSVPEEPDSDPVGAAGRLILGFAVGAVLIGLGGVLFCLRRIGAFMGVLAREMRAAKEGGA